MCWCNPNLRTICCGGVDCYPPNNSTISNSTILNIDKFLEDAKLSMWQSYCDKKVECEEMRELLLEASALLTQGTQEHCEQLANEIILYLESK